MTGDDGGPQPCEARRESQPANPHQRAAKARSQPGPRAHAPHPTPGSHRRPRDPPAAKRPNSQQKRRQDKGAKRKGGSWVWWRGTRSRFLMLNEDFLLKAMPRMFYTRVGIIYPRGFRESPPLYLPRAPAENAWRQPTREPAENAWHPPTRAPAENAWRPPTNLTRGRGLPPNRQPELPLAAPPPAPRYSHQRLPIEWHAKQCPPSKLPKTARPP